MNYRLLLNLFTCFFAFMPWFYTAIFAGVRENSFIDRALLGVMKAYQVPVVGYAIIDHNKIVVAKTLSIDPQIKVSTHSLFQAASISKSVSAYGALKLVSESKLKLDNPVNLTLQSWKIPVNQFNKNHSVTLRQILNMTSGLSVSGFPGYEQGESLPNLIQLLNGELPANNAAIRVFYKPGSRYFYSGGSFQVLQQLIQDVEHKPFSVYMNQYVLKPLNMKQSVYQFPLVKKFQMIAVPGFDEAGKQIQGGWHNYAIAASGGLWSTPIDLAQFALSVTQSYLSANKGYIPQLLARDMLTRGNHTDFGFGVIINGRGKTLNFRKNGHNYGYHNQLIMFPNVGKGLVIMTDSENGMAVINYITPFIARQYHWPCFFPFSFELIVIPKFACYATN